MLRTEGMDIFRAASLGTPILAGDSKRKARAGSARNDARVRTTATPDPQAPAIVRNATQAP